MPSAAFEKAWEDVKKIRAKPTDQEKLSLYGYGVIARGDKKFEEAKKPGMFDFEGKAKYGKWEQLVNEGVTQKDAEQKYVDLVEELKKNYGFDE